MPVSVAGVHESPSCGGQLEFFQNLHACRRVSNGMVIALRLLVAVLTLGVLTACQPPAKDPEPDVRGGTWRPVNTVEPPESRMPLLTVRLPGDTVPEQTQRVDLDSFLVVEVAYEACHWDDPLLAGVAADRIEVRLTELPRYCVRPIPRLALFSIPWTDVPDPVTIVDHGGGETRLQDRRRN